MVLLAANLRYRRRSVKLPAQRIQGIAAVLNQQMRGIGEVFQVITFGILHAQAGDAVEQIACGLDTVDCGFEESASRLRNRVGSVLGLLWRGV